jgi:hypothetical protein
VSGDEVRDVSIFQARDALNRSQASDGVSRRRCSEKVAEDPIIPCVAVEEPTGDYRPDFEPRFLVGSDGASKEIDVLDDAVRLKSGELDERVEDGSRAEGKANKGDGPDTDMPVDKRVRKDEAGRLCAVERVGPRTGDSTAY